MASRNLPGLGLTAYWSLGENGWKDGMDVNMRTLSALTNMRVLNAVASLPGSPVNGDIYLVTSGTEANKIAVRDNGVWVYLVPMAGWRLFDATAGVFKYYNGSAWVNELPTTLGGMTLLATLNATGVSYLDFVLPVETYKVFEVVLSGLKFSAASDLWLRTSSNDGSSFDSAASDYSWAHDTVNTVTQTLTNSNADSKIIAGRPQLSNSSGWAGRATLFNANESSRWQNIMFEGAHCDVSGTGWVRNRGAGHFRSTSGNRVNALRFLPSTGAFTAGNAYLYGLRSSLA